MKLVLKIFIVLILCILQSSAQTYNWPCTPFNQQHWIIGTFCENRPSGSILIDHFHDGVDIDLAEGNNVYSVITGTVNGLLRGGLNAYVRIGRYAYVHVEPSPALGIGSSVTAFQTVVGLTNSYNHIHFIDGYNGSEINPLRSGGGLDPFNDSFNPNIDWIKFYVNSTTTEFTDGRVNGPVEIVAKARDKTDSGPLGDNNGVYKIGYQVLDSAGSSPLTDELVRFQFDQISPNSYVTNVFFPGSDLSNYLYTLTNNITSDSFWDTRLLDPGVYQIRVFTEDTRGNMYERSRTVEIIPQDTWPPVVPVLKAVEGNNQKGWTLTWQANDSADVGGYHFYFSYYDTTWIYQSTISNEISATDTSYQFDNFTNDATVYFRLAAHDNAAIPNISDTSDAYGVRLSASGPQALIVDGFDRTNGYWPNAVHNFVVKYGEVLTDLNLPFNSCSNEAIIKGDITLGDYAMIIYLLGDESGETEALSTSEQNMITEYLRSGGKMIISGSHIGLDLVQNGSSEDSSFFNQYLKANYISHVSGLSDVSGVSGTFMDGLSIAIEAPGGGNLELDVIEPVNSEMIMTYGNGSTAGIFYEGIFPNGTVTAQLAYFTFPIELITDKGNRTTLLSNIIKQFNIIDLITPREDLSPPQSFGLRNYPNPFNPLTRIRYQLNHPATVRLTIYNIQGEKVKDLVDARQPAGEYIIIWEGTDNSGKTMSTSVYIYRLDVNGRSVNKKMMLIR